MTWFILVGDMLVMAFMAGLAIWIGNRGNDEQIRETAMIPLQDEEGNG